MSAVAAAFAIAATLLWFNRYSFSEMRLGDSVFPVRTSRFTGKSQVFIMGHWREMGQPHVPQGKEQVDLPAGDLRDIEGKAGIQEVQYFDKLPKHFLRCNVYNGTKYSLIQLTIKLRVNPAANQPGVNREYVLLCKSGDSVGPLSNGDFEADIGLNPQPDTWTWQIVRATGTRAIDSSR